MKKAIVEKLQAQQIYHSMHEHSLHNLILRFAQGYELPLPDWDKAPKDARWWAVTVDGWGIWYPCKKMPEKRYNAFHHKNAQRDHTINWPKELAYYVWDISLVPRPMKKERI